MTIALTGGTGFVGQAVLDEAAKRGAGIRALTRRTQPALSGVEWFPGDLADKRGLAALVEGAEVVLHIAGAVSAPDEAGFEAGNVAGTMNLVEAAVTAGVRRFIFVSSLAAREPQLSAYGASKRRAEQIVAASGLDWTTVRPPAIYGPRDKEMLDLFRMAKWGVVPMPPEGRASLIHVDDLAHLLLDLVPARRATTDAILEPDDGKPGGWHHADWAKAIGRAVGREVWVPHIPEGMLHALSSGEKLLRGSGAKLTRDRVNYMVHPDWVCAPERAVHADIWRPAILTEQGLRATAEWYRKEGWL